MLYHASTILIKEEDRLYRLTVQDTCMYGLDEHLVLQNYKSFEELSMSFVNGLKPTVWAKNQNKVEISIKEPFTYPFIINSNWRQVKLENKERINIELEDQTKQVSIDDGNKAFESNFWHPKKITVYYPGNKPISLPTFINGEFNLKIPSEVKHYQLTQNDVGKKHEENGIEYTLLTIENGFVEIEVNNPYQNAGDSNNGFSYPWVPY